LYDGGRSGDWLKDGLGLLVDGQIGADNFRVDIGYGKGKYVHTYVLFPLLPNPARALSILILLLRAAGLPRKGGLQLLLLPTGCK